MGLMIEGKWQTDEGKWAANDGSFHRERSQFRCAFGEGDLEGATDRYHLYVSLACPWAHRALLFRKLKGLESIIPVTVVDPKMLESGWVFPEPEPLYGLEYLYQLYARADSHYNGRVTVPVLWDRRRSTIVCNESAEIIRIFNTAFNDLTGNREDYYPASLRGQIDEINTFVYDNINNGVYRCGFATKQSAYEQAYASLFAALDKLEQRLSGQRWLLGEQLTEADWRLFTTLIRFDAVYYGHFKCNRNRIVDMPVLWAYVRDLYQQPGIADTVNFTHIKQHYYYSHAAINPTRIVPVGPQLDFTVAQQRAMPV